MFIFILAVVDYLMKPDLLKLYDLIHNILLSVFIAAVQNRYYAIWFL
ncbi:MAG TPA: hypothetical protein GX732_11225 [Pseudomonas sp.]|nr:hypothetical protein [Pseudomonas sp.]